MAEQDETKKKEKDMGNARLDGLNRTINMRPVTRELIKAIDKRGVKGLAGKALYRLPKAERRNPLYEFIATTIESAVRADPTLVLDDKKRTKTVVDWFMEKPGRIPKEMAGALLPFTTISRVDNPVMIDNFVSTATMTPVAKIADPAEPNIPVDPAGAQPPQAAQGQKFAPSSGPAPSASGVVGPVLSGAVDRPLPVTASGARNAAELGAITHKPYAQAPPRRPANPQEQSLKPQLLMAGADGGADQGQSKGPNATLLPASLVDEAPVMDSVLAAMRADQATNNNQGFNVSMSDQLVVPPEGSSLSHPVSISTIKAAAVNVSNVAKEIAASTELPTPQAIADHINSQSDTNRTSELGQRIVAALPMTPGNRWLLGRFGGIITPFNSHTVMTAIDMINNPSSVQQQLITSKDGPQQVREGLMPMFIRMARAVSQEALGAPVDAPFGGAGPSRMIGHQDQDEDGATWNVGQNPPHQSFSQSLLTESLAKIGFGPSLQVGSRIFGALAEHESSEQKHDQPPVRAQQGGVQLLTPGAPSQQQQFDQPGFAQSAEALRGTAEEETKGAPQGAPIEQQPTAPTKKFVERPIEANADLQDEQRPQQLRPTFTVPGTNLLERPFEEVQQDAQAFTAFNKVIPWTGDMPKVERKADKARFTNTIKFPIKDLTKGQLVRLVQTYRQRHIMRPSNLSEGGDPRALGQFVNTAEEEIYPTDTRDPRRAELQFPFRSTGGTVYGDHDFPVDFPIPTANKMLPVIPMQSQQPVSLREGYQKWYEGNTALNPPEATRRSLDPPTRRDNVDTGSFGWTFEDGVSQYLKQWPVPGTETSRPLPRPFNKTARTTHTTQTTNAPEASYRRTMTYQTGRPSVFKPLPFM